MKAFTTFTGIIAPLDRANVDTDAIIPKQFLKSIERTGFGRYLFDNWRYLDQVDMNDTREREVNPEFVLNRPPYNQAEILLARENFGCGSSREHAVWSLMDFGFRAVLAPGYSDIFYSNAFKNGFLPICLKAHEVNALFKAVESEKGFRATVNLDEQYVETQTGDRYPFEIDAGLKERLLKGLDDIDLTLQHVEAIRAYEKDRAKITPWLFKEIST